MKKIDPFVIISKYYDPGSISHMILVEHGRAVAGKALDIARKLAQPTPDMEFIEEASLLHDIGIFMTNAPQIGCYGDKDYICHGFLGRELLEKEGLPRHALVCERHVGMGIDVHDVDARKLPIPRREMVPLTLEERIICFADKFFSKKVDALGQPKPIEEVRRSIAGYGADKLERFDEMLRAFGA